jgi:DNA (cytosine-5)-methyltransferase 1
MRLVAAYAGGGGVECGAIATGIKPVLSIECNPNEPQLSKALAESNRQNFGHEVIEIPFEQWVAAGTPYCEKGSFDIFHASPMCSNFSQAKIGRQEEKSDIDAATAIAQFLDMHRPKHFTLENVLGYQASAAFGIICAELDAMGYIYNSFVADCSDYGVPQSRKRLFLVATQHTLKAAASLFVHPLGFPLNWWDAIKQATLEATTLTRAQETSLKSCDRYSSGRSLIPRVGYRTFPRVIPHDKPAPTITKSLFLDGKGGRRSQVWTVWDGDRQQAYNVGIEQFKRLATFPEWYQLPSDAGVAGAILGYAVPPRMMEQIFASLIEGLDGVDHRTAV